MMDGIFVDIGGTNIRFGLCGISTEKPELCISTPHNRDNIIEDVSQNITSLRNKYSINNDRVLVSCAGLISNDGHIEKALYLDLSGVYLKSELESRCNMHFIVENDANVQAFGRFNDNSLLYLTIGTAVGGAYVDNNGIFKGNNGFSCEFGHVFVNSGRDCFCGRNGCLDSILSGKRMIEQFGNYWSRCKQDTVFNEYLAFCGRKLVNALRTLCALFDPYEITICGKICDNEVFCNAVYKEWNQPPWNGANVSFEHDSWKLTYHAACKILE